jgi:hypothetical protein
MPVVKTRIYSGPLSYRTGLPPQGQAVPGLATVTLARLDNKRILLPAPLRDSVGF